MSTANREAWVPPFHLLGSLHEATDQDWFNVSITRSGDYIIQTFSPDCKTNSGEVDTELELWTRSNSDPTRVAYDDDGGSGSSSKVICYRLLSLRIGWLIKEEEGKGGAGWWSEWWGEGRVTRAEAMDFLAGQTDDLTKLNKTLTVLLDKHFFGTRNILRANKVVQSHYPSTGWLRTCVWYDFTPSLRTFLDGRFLILLFLYASLLPTGFLTNLHFLSWRLLALYFMDFSYGFFLPTHFGTNFFANFFW